MTRQFEILELTALISVCILNTGCKGNKSSDQLKNDVVTNEESFKILVDYFTSSLPDSDYIVTFGIGEPNSVHLTYYKNHGNIADKKNHYGSDHLLLHSSESDSAIRNLGWTYETVKTLAEKLDAIQMKYIRNTDWFGKPINIYNDPRGFVNSDYNIYPTEKLDTVRTVHGAPVGQTDFLKRVYVITTSAL